MENMDKGLTAPTWVPINRLKIAQIYLPKPKNLKFRRKKASLVVRIRGIMYYPLKVDDRNEICQSHQL